MDRSPCTIWINVEIDDKNVRRISAKIFQQEQVSRITSVVVDRRSKIVLRSINHL
jgi:hypothetical protein